MKYTDIGRTICLIGESGAGKSTVAQILVEVYGYQCLSLSDQVREHASEQGIFNPSRKDLQILANQARKLDGTDYFARRGMLPMSSDVYLVVEGIRHLREYEHILNSRHGRFLTSGILACRDTRYARVLERARPSDPIDYKQFVENDEREWGVARTEFSQNTEELMEMVDVILFNDVSIDELNEAVGSMLEMFGFTIKEEGIHPDPESKREYKKGPERE